MGYIENSQVAFIINPTAGSGLTVSDRRDIEGVMTSFHNHGNTVTPRVTRGPGHATEIAKEIVNKNIPTIIVVGGDGTMNEVVNGTAGSEVVVGNIPTGFLNIWAREMGIPANISDAGEVMLRGQERRIDLGEVNGNKFLQFANLGFDSEEYMKVHGPGTVREESGKATFYKVFAKCLRDGWFYRGHNAHITLDGEEFSTNLLIGVIGNSRKYGRLTVRDDVVLDDGVFESSFFTGATAFHFLPEFGRILLNMSEGRGLQRGKMREGLVIETAPHDRIGMTIDGNPVGYFDTIEAKVLTREQSVLVGK